MCFKKISILILFFAIIFCFSANSQTKSGNLKNKGGKVGSKTVDKNARIGGRETIPHGIDENTILNIGIGSGISFPGLDMLNEEHLAPGSNSHFYIHYLLPKTRNIGVGLNANMMMYNVNNSKFDLDYQNVKKVISPSWNFQTVCPSLFINHKITRRVSAQFLFNAGVMMVQVPKTTVNFSDTLDVTGLAIPETEYLYEHKNTTEIGWSASFGMQFNYLLVQHLELRFGSDFLYGRFNITKNQLLPTLSSEKLLREMKTINVFAGIALNF